MGRERVHEDGATVLGYGPGERRLIWAGFPLLGVLVGSGVPLLARWVLSWGTPLPLRPVVRVLGSMDRWWEVGVNVAVWVVVGLVVARTAVREDVVFTVRDDGLLVEGEGYSAAVDRQDVAAVFRDGPVLVVLDAASRQLVREKPQAGAKRDAVAAAFRAHGYPWHEQDPLAHRFVPWTAGGRGLPPGVHPLLDARHALRGKDARRSRELRQAAEGLGVVVRDEGDHQHWRPLEDLPH